MTDAPQTYDDAQMQRVFEAGWQEASPVPAHDIAADCETYEEAELAVCDGWSYYTESAHYCHTVLPDLRRETGFEDSGMGTFTLVPDESVHYRLDELTEAFRRGWEDRQLAAVRRHTKLGEDPAHE